jgi:hypothetical protein
VDALLAAADETLPPDLLAEIRSLIEGPVSVSPAR